MKNAAFKLTVVVLTGLLAWFGREGVSAGRQAPPDRQADRPVDFNRDIRPILSDNCFSCHGPDESKRRARLRFDTRDGASSKPGLIVPRNAAQSILFQRISAPDKDRLMPPVDSGYALTAAQVELIRKWIEQGAVWTEHWAYRAPKATQPPVPSNASRIAWPRNPIDNFVLARLEREGLQPSPEADKVTQLRRVTLDLTGLPPTPAEVDAFLADHSSNAYERRVDQLLNSPAYGERMAMQWLDLARYADTHGYHIDSHRDMWPWRDWVIGAFNRNVPFDRFTIEQLAGDLLPNATLEQKIASGFNRNHMINFEGGAIPEEYQTEYVVDRVETVSTTWLGTTMGCARCHTHKYDPISQREFYQFFAFFNNVGEEGLDGNRGNAKPMLPMPSDQQKARLDALTGAVKLAEADLAEVVIAPLESAWSKPMLGRIASAPRDGLVAHYELDGNFSDLSGRLQHGRGISGDPNFVTGVIGRAVAFDGDTQATFGNVGNIDRDEKFTIAFWVRGNKSQPMTALQKIDAGAQRGYEFGFSDRELIAIQKFAQRLTFRLMADSAGNAIRIRTVKSFPMGEWLHLSLTSDGSSRASGIRLFVNGEIQPVEVLQDSLTASVRNAGLLQVGAAARAFAGAIDDLRIYTRVLEVNEIEQLAIRYPVDVILSGLLGKRTKEEETRLREYFLTYAASEQLKKRYLELKALRKEREQLNKDILTVMVMDEREKPRETFVLGRGDYRNRTDKVTADVPAVLPPLPAEARRDRLTLAKWLVDGKHPLTGRVAVNRFWQSYFGIGIVKTVEDFGSQGDPPTHPELLDWLAVEFVRSGWDIKAMQRLIVTSATYRQSSRVPSQLLEKDPENRLFARGPRHRLQAETIRDNALAASGLLNSELGGPSVFPYQSPGLWEELAFGDGFSAQEYKLSRGKDLYRRSLYTFWKRTVPPASLATFDAPDREKCVARRPVTNTPLQALIVLNDPTYVEAARAIATRTLREGGRDSGARIQYAFRLIVARRATRLEQQVLMSLLNTELAKYRRDRMAAAKLIAVGQSTPDANVDTAELAAWTVVASAMLNLDEAITKE